MAAPAVQTLGGRLEATMPSSTAMKAASSRVSAVRSPRRAVARPRPAAASGAAAAAPTEQPRHLGGHVDWAVEVTRNTLTLPQVLQHLEQLERIEAAAARRRAAAAASGRSSGGGASAPNKPPPPPSRDQHTVSWVEHSTSAAASLMEGIMSDAESSSEEGEELLSALAALPPDQLTEAQQAAVVLAAWDSASHTKPENFDAGTQLVMPGLAEVAVVSRGGWQRRSWKGCNQDAFLALPLAAGSAACQDCPSSAACCSAAVAIGVFDGHGRAGEAASSHLRNALASGLLMHNQLALMARPACQQGAGQGQGHSRGGSGHGMRHGKAQAAEAEEQQGDAAVDEAAALLERCFAAAASTMPSTGADFSLSGSTAVMCLVQPGSVTAAWAGDSRAVLGLHKGGRYIACALTRDHKPSSPLERARIEQAGGWVMQTLVNAEGRPVGPHRVYLPDSTIPGLAVSRCFGDFVAATAGVTSTPDVTTLVLPTCGGHGGGGKHHGHEHGGHGQGQGRGPRGGGGKSQPQQQRGGQQGALKGGPPAPGGHVAPAAHRNQHQRQQQRRRGGQPGPGRQQQPPAPAARRADGHGPRGFAPTSHHILIVASDGLWEFVSNAEAVRIASKCPTAQLAAEALTLEAQAQWALKFGGAHCDDITVAVAFLPDQA